jgi:hypothetical protein
MSLSRLLPLFINNLLPIFLAAGAGYLIAKNLGVVARPVSQLSFYIFSPCLLFNMLTTSELTNNDIARMAAYSVTIALLMGMVGWLAARWLRYDRRMTAAFMLVVMFSNSGNFGLSLNLFAFGEAGLAYASVYFAAMIVTTYTLGILIASLGNANSKNALLSLMRVPATYAIILALLSNTLNIDLPLPLDRTVATLSNAAIPMLLVVMGIQLHQVNWNSQLRALGLANALKMAAAPMFGLAVAPLFGFSSPAYQVAITQTSMPTAVLMTVLATEYNLEPAFVTAAVTTSTLLSPLTLTPLLAYLGA